MRESEVSELEWKKPDVPNASDTTDARGVRNGSSIMGAPDSYRIPSVIGLARLAVKRFSGDDVMPVYRQLARRLNEDDTNVAPLMDIAIIDQLLGSAERGLAVQAAALKAQRIFRLESVQRNPGLRLVGFAMAGPVNANIPIEFLIEDTDVTLYTIYVVPGAPLPVVPEHDLAIVLVAESELARPVLCELERIVADWPYPVLNAPWQVPLLGRDSLHRLIKSIPGIEIPATVRVDADTLAAIARGDVEITSVLPDGGFPIIARPLDSHAGHGLECVNTAVETDAYLTRNPAAEYFLSRYVDYRSPDGQFRKYRIAVIDGVPYPSHLAISDDWMVHFLSARMEEEHNRSEEARFMEMFRDEFARRHGPALAQVADRSGLEYFGVDCGETQDGKLLIFEADTSLIIHNMDCPTVFPYKGPAMRALFAAFRSMLFRKAGLAPPELNTAL